MTQPDERDEGSPNDDILAGEFALGVLDAAGLRAAEHRVLTEPAFAARVGYWQERLAPLAVEIASVTVPERVWRGLEARLFPDASRFASGARDSLADGLADAWQRRLRLWRAATGVMAAAALALAVALAVVFAGRDPAPAGLVASLQGEGAGPVFLARLDPSAGRLVIRPVAAADAAERVPELWLIPGDGTPRSLGLMAPDGVTELSLTGPLADLAGPDTTLAISLEPPGGSPTGQPTGPVVAAGKIQAL